jgi:hypothetical protein
LAATTGAQAFGSRDELIAEAVERALTDSEPRLVEIAAGAQDR